MKKYLLGVTFLFFFVSCDEELDTPQYTDPNPNDVELRIYNKSNFHLDSVFVKSGNRSLLFNSVVRKRTSNFKSVVSAYDEMEIRFKIEERKFLHQPNVFDTKLESGRYELELDQIDSTSLSFTFLLREVQ